MVLAHMTQVFLHAPTRSAELTWCVGVVLLLLTMGMFFTGRILRRDPDAYWGLAVGGSMAGRVPLIGPWVVELLLGGPIIGGAALSRFFALHVFVIPGLLLFFLVIHLWLVVKCGISSPPQPGRLVDPKTYDESGTRRKCTPRVCPSWGRPCTRTPFSRPWRSSRWWSGGVAGTEGAERAA